MPMHLACMQQILHISRQCRPRLLHPLTNRGPLQLQAFLPILVKSNTCKHPLCRDQSPPLSCRRAPCHSQTRLCLLKHLPLRLRLACTRHSTMTLHGRAAVTSWVSRLQSISSVKLDHATWEGNHFCLSPTLKRKPAVSKIARCYTAAAHVSGIHDRTCFLSAFSSIHALLSLQQCFDYNVMTILSLMTKTNTKLQYRTSRYCLAF